MRPEAGQLLHFSEDPTITVFAPRVAATSRERSPYVWAVDAEQAPAYWFPRQCPRVTAWVTDGSTGADVDRILGPGGGRRVHAIEYRWLERMRSVRLFAYRLPAADFAPDLTGATRPPGRRRARGSGRRARCAGRTPRSCAAGSTAG